MAVPDNVVPFPKAPTPTSDPAPLTEETNFLQKAGFKYSGLNDWLINYIDGTKDLLGKYQPNLHEKPKNEQPSPREDNHMDWQEKYIDKLDRDMGEIKTVIRATEDRIGNLLEKSLAETNLTISRALEEMRDRDNQRHQDFLAMNQEFNEARRDLANTRWWVIGTAITLILGISGLIYANLQLLTSISQIIQQFLSSPAK